MRTDRTVTRPSSEPVSMRLIVDRQTPVKTLPPLAVGKNTSWAVGDPGLPKRRVPDSERFSTGYILANVYRKLHKMRKKGQEKNIFCAPSKSASVKINCIGGFKEGARDVPTSKKSWIRHCTKQDNNKIFFLHPCMTSVTKTTTQWILPAYLCRQKIKQNLTTCSECSIRLHRKPSKSSN